MLINIKACNFIIACALLSTNQYIKYLCFNNFRVAIVNKEGQQPYSDPHFVLVI